MLIKQKKHRGIYPSCWDILSYNWITDNDQTMVKIGCYYDQNTRAESSSNFFPEMSLTYFYSGKREAEDLEDLIHEDTEQNGGFFIDATKVSED